MTPLPVITVQHVTFGYDREPVLKDIELTISKGQFIGVVGPSGSGKTSLLKLLLGTVKPNHGTVTRAKGTAVSYVPQIETVSWSFPATVTECVLMARATHRLSPFATKAERADVADVLERLGIADLGQRHIRELSGGQQQRMFIARALVRKPDLLLMDEPTSGVDVATRHEVLHLLGDLNAEGLSILLTTHDLNGMASHLPHLIALQQRVVATGTPAQVIVPDVLERVFGARMEVMMHLGMPVVVDTGRRGVA